MLLGGVGSLGSQGKVQLQWDCPKPSVLLIGGAPDDVEFELHCQNGRGLLGALGGSLGSLSRCFPAAFAIRSTTSSQWQAG
jgi:hypothetical protein